MPFSFSNISSSVLIFMVLYLTIAEIVNYLRKHHGAFKKIALVQFRRLLKILRKEPVPLKPKRKEQV